MLQPNDVTSPETKHSENLCTIVMTTYLYENISIRRSYGMRGCCIGFLA